jgi:hypothetical protein
MLRVLFWQLPIVDVFALRRILKYYRSLGIRVPEKHAKVGLVERWVGYLPVGFVLSQLLGFGLTLAIMLLVFAVLGPLELWLMLRGTTPWKFFAGAEPETVVRIFVLEFYNVMGYYLMGALLGAVV